MGVTISERVKPIEALLTFIRSRNKNYPSIRHTERHTLEEQYAAALLAIGFFKAYGEVYTVSPVNDYLAPDIYLTRSDTVELPGKEVEVVRYTPHSSKKVDLAEFLVSTKLSSKYAYPSETVILCHVDGVFPHCKWGAVHETLKNAPRQHELWVVLRTEMNSFAYVLIQLLPSLGEAIQFNVVKDGYEMKRSILTS